MAFMLLEIGLIAPVLMAISLYETGSTGIYNGKEGVEAGSKMLHEVDWSSFLLHEYMLQDVPAFMSASTDETKQPQAKDAISKKRTLASSQAR